MRILASIFLAALAVAAQDARGRISGRITDSSGASVPAAEVAAIKQDTGVRVASQSSAEGVFELPLLPPGTYRVEAQSAGFKRYVRDGFDVRAGERLTLDVTLEIGQITESVNVTGQAALIETGTATIGHVVDRRSLIELPLPGGNSFALARLSAGVVNLGAPNHPSLGPAVEVLSNISVNGVRPGNTEFTIDGAPSMWGTNASYAPPAEMVAEFKVQTATYDASVGRSPGGSVNVALRSGTNKLHGSFYEFHNNQAITGMDLFQRQLLYNPQTGPVTEAKKAQANPRNILNRFGANVSGPVMLPKMYDGRNKTFWIFGWEMLTRPGVERGNNFYTVPDAAQRRGDFSQLLRLGAAYQVYDPATATAAPGGRIQRLPLAGNIIPGSRLDRGSQRLLEFFPSPNSPGTADGRNNYQRLPQSYNEFRSYTTKVDHNLSTKHRVFGRYTRTFNLFSASQLFETPTTGTDRYRRMNGAGFDDVYTFSPTLLTNFRYGFSLFQQQFVPLSAGFDPASIGLNAALVAVLDPQGRQFPSLGIEGYTAIGGANYSNAKTNFHSWNNDWTKIAGQHSIRFGGEFRLYREHNYNFANAVPAYSFAAAFTRGPLDNSPVAPIGQGMASFLLGLPTGGQLNTNASLAEQSTTTGLYVQDDWRVTKKLSLNLGLRWDYDSPVTERFNRSVRGFAADTASPIEAAARAAYAQSPSPLLAPADFRVRGGLTFAGVGGQPRTLWKGDRNNIAPRIGVAYNVNDKFVLRGGYGVYYIPFGSDRQSVNQSGYSIVNTLVPSNDNGLTFMASLANPFPTGLIAPPGSSAGLSTDIGRNVNYFNEAPLNGFMQRFSFGAQREVWKGLVADLSFVGNRGRGLGVMRGLNPLPNRFLSTTGARDQATINRLTSLLRNPFAGLAPGTALNTANVATQQLLRPYPHFTGVGTDQQIGRSWYNSMQARLEKRFSKGFQFQFDYTWSKNIEAIGFLNGGDDALERVISDIDRPHRIAFSGIYELPFGLQLQAVWQRNSGPALGFGNALLLAPVTSFPSSSPTLGRWFNIDAFDRVPGNQLDLNLRSLSSRFTGVRAPFQETWDLSMLKNFAIRERLRLQLRTEFLNAMNRTNLANPNTAPTNTLFGQITANNGFPRQLHVALKLMF